MKILMTILLLLSSVTASAQGALEREHPLVSELQDKLTDYARDYLQTRLQGVPFMVTVKIEALRRATGSNYRPQQEKLPYYDLSEEEIRDEWDDPSASLYVLQSRIQKATVMISLPKALKDEEVQEIKDTLSNLLRLIPGRDEVKVEQRNWSLGTNFWYYAMLSLGGLVLLLIGMTFISRNWAKKLAGAISAIKPKERADGEGAGISTAGTNPGLVSPASSSNGSGDLKFRDPLKTREFISGRIQELLKNPGFPNLQAMIEMDRLAERHPKDLGALLMEFPIAMQKQLFGLSFKPSWLTAFTEPGELTGDSIELIDRLCRLQYEENDKEWEQLVIQVWRQGTDRVNFLKSLTKDEAFAILKHMPSSVAVPAARVAFPGSWAVLLDPTFKPITLSAGRIKEIYWYTLEKKPLNDFAALERFRQEKDLLSYLLISTLPEEKDIYGALQQNSFLWQVRPPFFLVLEQKEETLKKVFERVTLDEWALALFNVARDFRQPIEKLFNSKQKFIFINKMKAIEQSGLDRSVMGQARERIAKVFYHLSNNEEQEVAQVENIGAENNNEEEKQDNVA